MSIKMTKQLSLEKEEALFLVIEKQDAYITRPSINYSFTIEVRCANCDKIHNIELDNWSDSEHSIDCDCGARVDLEIDEMTLPEENDLCDIGAYVATFKNGDCIDSDKKVPIRSIADVRRVYKELQKDPYAMCYWHKGEKHLKAAFKQLKKWR